MPKPRSAAQILVVDDGSTDGTTEIGRAASLRDARITTMRIDELPTDWLGKSYALWRCAFRKICGAFSGNSATPWVDLIIAS